MKGPFVSPFKSPRMGSTSFLRIYFMRDAVSGIKKLSRRRDANRIWEGLLLGQTDIPFAQEPRCRSRQVVSPYLSFRWPGYLSDPLLSEDGPCRRERAPEGILGRSHPPTLGPRRGLPCGLKRPYPSCKFDPCPGKSK